MIFSDFAGLGQLPARLQADFDGGRFVHAYLFVGPQGTGKAEMAAICARALNCAGAHKPCGECPACQRALAGVHPDIIDVRPHDGKASISVDEVRALIGKVSVRPFEGGHHAVIVHGADLLTPQAQNALLKTLEAGPQACVFFLLAQSQAKLLTTILSRCRIVRFHAIDEEICAMVLARRGIDRDRALKLSRAAGGSVGRALDLNEDGEYWALRDRVIRALTATAQPGGISAASQLLKDDKDSAKTAIEIIEGVGRAKMAQDAGMIKKDPALAGIGARGDQLVRAALSGRERLESNVVWINLIEHLLMNIDR